MDILRKNSKNVCILQATQERWLKELKSEGMIYLYAMTGFGKTTQAIAFAESHYSKWIRISASGEGFLDEIDNIIESESKARVNTLIILDDLQWVFAGEDRNRLFEQILKLRQINKIYVFMISRASVPAYIAPLQVTRQLAVENQEALRFDEEKIKEMMTTYQAIANMPEVWREKTIYQCMLATKGYVVGINAYFQRLDSNMDDFETARRLAINDVFEFYNVHLLGEWTMSRSEAAMRLSVYEHFDKNMARKLLGDQTDNTLQDFSEVGSFMHYKSPDDYCMAPFFRLFLVTQLCKKDKKEWVPLFEIAAEEYEQKRDYEMALKCWKQAERQDKVVELVVYLSENAEGCAFAKIAQQYIEELSPEWEKREPRVLGAKVMLAAYRMKPEECMAYLDKLKSQAKEERKCVMKGGAMTAYVRTAIACPYDTADKLKDNMLYFADYVRKNGFHLNNIMPTGNMPSLINGGLDLLPWEKNKKLLYPVIKVAAELIMGKEAVGIADACMGEILYEQNQSTKAMAYLTKGLSAANCNGSVRVQYAATAIMARLFQSEGQYETAMEILYNFKRKAEQEHFNELIPNLHATYVGSAILKADTLTVDEWLKNGAPDEHEEFYITMRFQLLTKAKVYTMYEKTIEALFILNVLEEFAVIYKRTYFHIEVLLLKAIILFRREEPWKETLFEAVELAKPYELVRVFADQGVALLPLWKQIDWEEEKRALSNQKVITREMKKMAQYYPKYLQLPRKTVELSKKEKEVLKLIADGYNNSQIANTLQINLGTAKFHVSNIMKKLEAENRTVAVKNAKESGLI